MVNTTVYLFETDRTSRVGMVGGMNTDNEHYGLIEQLPCGRIR